jgi:hypothetical protein
VSFPIIITSVPQNLFSMLGHISYESEETWHFDIIGIAGSSPLYLAKGDVVEIKVENVN